MGRRMSGIESWAMVEPSVYSTIEWTIDCGWTTTSMWSRPMPTPASPAGTPKSSWASITSRPLFMRVDESTVIFGPIDQVGWARASSTVTSASSAARAAPERPAAGGEHHPAHPVRAVGVGAAAGTGAPRQCSLSTGTSSAPGASRAALHDRPPGDERLLVGQGQPPARRQGGQGDPEPGEADHPVDAHVGLGAQARQALGAGAHLEPAGTRRGQLGGLGLVGTATTSGRTLVAWSTSSVEVRPEAPRATTRYRSGSAATTSRVWVPMEPVDPASATVVVIGRRAAGRRRRSGRSGDRRRGSSTAGSTKSRASKRSSTPPWPGRIEPMSLTPRSRLTRDSHRSPRGAASAGDEAQQEPVAPAVERVADAQRRR